MYKDSPSAEFFERRSDDCILANYAIATSPYIGQITSDDSIRLYYHFSMQYNVLRAAQYCQPAHFIS